ncbi:enoyl-CoA hydratase/isomerase family protein [Phenylobacterium sp.]|uniref:enoyl-CoA hydratase/isomerase family protein n=1 Tax=Phenylobacterium sp. TaxID=1871053 RepID=UPI00273331A8|nr:enoyl-CoA hydratase/isomerase family protein [Phenylobacterium sp.]MDP3852470.1 enoyl-CoA hydratase-related protein [Phenylobacterium sp.]
MNALAQARAPFHRRTQAPEALPFATIEIRASVAVIRLELPSPGLWDAQEQQLFITSLTDLAARGDLTAIVVQGAALFAEKPGLATPDFRAVVEAVAGSPLPVIAAIAGDAIGVGLELALACAGRVAARGGRFSFPDLRAGRLPTHGAIERLPRLIGMTRASDLLIFNATLDADAALEAGLIDAIAGRDVVAAAIDLAHSGVGNARACRSDTIVLDSDKADLFGVRLRVRREAPDQTAPSVALQALEAAARLPVRRAMADTARAAAALAKTDQAQALAYAAAGKATLERWGAEAAREVLARRLRWPLLREAVHMLDEGATPSQLDRCLMAFGFSEGPFALSDRLGMAALFGVAADGAIPADPWLCYSPTLDLMSDAHRHGGSSPGWYRRAEASSHLTFDPEVARIIQASATFQRICRQPMSDEVIAERCLLAAVNGAAELLQVEDNLTAPLLDAIWTVMLGFPAWKGGPLLQADRTGLDQVVEGLRKLQAKRNTAGAPCEIILRCAARGEGLG